MVGILKINKGGSGSGSGVSTGINPTPEEFTGANATGTSGDANRTLTSTGTPALVVVDNSTLHEGAGKDYTLSSNTITFLNALFDDQNISVYVEAT